MYPPKYYRLTNWQTDKENYRVALLIKKLKIYLPKNKYPFLLLSAVLNIFLIIQEKRNVILILIIHRYPIFD